MAVYPPRGTDPWDTPLLGWLLEKFAPRDGTFSEVTRDSAGRLATVTEQGVVTTITRDSAGRVASYQTGDGVTRTVTRDAFGRIVSVL